MAPRSTLIKINGHCSVRQTPLGVRTHDLDVRQSGKRTQTRSTTLPLAKGLEVVMFKRILIATDGSELADKAVVVGLTLAKALKAQATAITVTEPWDALSMAAIAEAQMRNPIADYEERIAAAANRILSPVAEKAKKLGVSCATVHVKERPRASSRRPKRRCATSS